MKTEYADQFKTNEFGDLDVNYYITKGRQLRSQAIAEMVRSLIVKLKSRRSKSHSLPLKPHFRH